MARPRDACAPKPWERKRYERTPPFPGRGRSRLAPIQGARVVGDTSLRLQIAQPHIPHLLGTNQHQGGHVCPPVLARRCDSSLSELLPLSKHVHVLVGLLLSPKGDLQFPPCSHLLSKQTSSTPPVTVPQPLFLCRRVKVLSISRGSSFLVILFWSHMTGSLCGFSIRSTHHSSVPRSVSF